MHCKNVRHWQPGLKKTSSWTTESQKKDMAWGIKPCNDMSSNEAFYFGCWLPLPQFYLYIYAIMKTKQKKHHTIWVISNFSLKMSANDNTDNGIQLVTIFVAQMAAAYPSSQKYESKIIFSYAYNIYFKFQKLSVTAKMLSETTQGFNTRIKSWTCSCKIRHWSYLLKHTSKH